MAQRHGWAVKYTIVGGHHPWCADEYYPRRVQDRDRGSNGWSNDESKAFLHPTKAAAEAARNHCMDSSAYMRSLGPENYVVVELGAPARQVKGYAIKRKGPSGNAWFADTCWHDGWGRWYDKARRVVWGGEEEARAALKKAKGGGSCHLVTIYAKPAVKPVPVDPDAGLLNAIAEVERLLTASEGRVSRNRIAGDHQNANLCAENSCSYGYALQAMRSNLTKAVANA